MPRILSFITLLFLSTIVHAQNDTTYFDDNYFKLNYHFGTYYRIVQLYPRENGNYKVSFYTTADNSLKKEGYYSYYNKYQHDSTIRNGEWISYAHGKIENIKNYNNGKLNGISKYYYKDTNVLHMVAFFNNDYIDSLRSYYPDGKLKRIEVYNPDRKSRKHRFLVKKCFDEDGNEISFTPYYKMPQHPSFDINKYLASNIKYPVTARKDNIEGRVIVRFVVDTNGTITHITVLQSVRKDIDNEAIRVIKQMPRWNPGTEDGEPIKVFFTIPISFLLRG